MKSLKGSNLTVLLWRLQSTEKMTTLREAIAAQTKYTVLVSVLF